MRRFHPCGRFVSIKKNAVRDGTLVLATKNTLCAQRKEAPCMQHAGGTSQLTRILTAQNNSFVQLPWWLVIRGRVGKLGYLTQRRRANRYSKAPGAKRPFRDTECLASLRLTLQLSLYEQFMNYSCFLCERSVKTSASA